MQTESFIPGKDASLEPNIHTLHQALLATYDKLGVPPLRCNAAEAIVQAYDIVQ